jgi:hypothetical protein
MVFRRLTLLSVLILAIGILGISAQTGEADPYRRFLSLTRSAPAAYPAGDKTLAAAQANALLGMADEYRGDWNYGNAVHAANLVLGRIAADEGRINDARERLILSVTSLPYALGPATRTPAEGVSLSKASSKASPQMDTFGPDMSLARTLLVKGEREAVLKYLELCANFWKMDNGNLSLWATEIKASRIPSFGPNLIYVFPKEANATH